MAEFIEAWWLSLVEATAGSKFCSLRCGSGNVLRQGREHVIAQGIPYCRKRIIMENKLKFIVPAGLCICYMILLSCSQEEPYKVPQPDTTGMTPIPGGHYWSQPQAIPVIFYIEEETIEPDTLGQ